MSYLPATAVKFCSVSSVVSGGATGFGLHLFNMGSNQDAELSSKGNARYNNTPLMGLYFFNWFINFGGTSADYQFNCKYNTVDDTTTFTGYQTSFPVGPNYYKNIAIGSVNQYHVGVNYPSLYPNVQTVGQPLFRINFNYTRNSVGAIRGTSSHTSTHMFMLPVGENR